MEKRGGLTCPFKAFLLSLSKNLKKEELDEAKFISTLGDSDKEKIISWPTFFDKLKELGHINENEVSALTSILESIGRDDLAAKCREFNKRNGKILPGSQTENITESKSLTANTSTICEETVNCTSRSSPATIRFDFSNDLISFDQLPLVELEPTVSLDGRLDTNLKTKVPFITSTKYTYTTPMINSWNPNLSVGLKAVNTSRQSSLGTKNDSADSLASEYEPPITCKSTPDILGQLQNRLDVREQTASLSKFKTPVAIQQGILVCCSECKEPLFDTSDIFKKGQNYLVKTPKKLPGLSCCYIAKTNNGMKCNKVLGTRIEMDGIENCFQLNNDCLVWRFSGEKHVFQDIKKWQKVSFYVPEIM